MNSCPLCHPANETILWQDERCRVILVDDADYPGFCRVIWGGHVKEMTDLTEPERAHLMAVVFATEEILREMLQPAKINLASLGNQVPHLHWHVIPRFTDDVHFPDPVWAARKRAARATPMDRPKLIRELEKHLCSSLD
ncbi:MAG: HIT family protein [Sulfuricaulis sp.]